MNKVRIIKGIDINNNKLILDTVEYNSISELLNKVHISSVYVEDRSKEICLEAVRQNGYVLKYVHNQTEEICLVAVKQNGYALQYVHNQTEQICLAAVKHNGLELQYIDIDAKFMYLFK